MMLRFLNGPTLFQDRRRSMVALTADKLWNPQTLYDVVENVAGPSTRPFPAVVKFVVVHGPPSGFIAPSYASHTDLQ